MNNSAYIKSYLNRIESLPIGHQKIFFSKLPRLSESQKRILEVEKNLTDINNVTLIPLIVNENISKERIEEAINRIVRKHEILRTVFKDLDGELKQLILPPFGIHLTEESLEQATEETTTEKINKLISQSQAERFKPETEFAWRCKIQKLHDSKRLVIFIFHQTIFDGLSFHIFLDEMLNPQNAGNPLKIQYADYTRWQEKILSPDYLKANIYIWREKFRDFENEAKLPADKKRPSASLCRANNLEIFLSEEETRFINRFCSVHKITITMLGVATLALLLFHLTRSEQTTVGIPLAGRSMPGSERLIGSFVNIAPLHISLKGQISIIELLYSIRNEMLFLQENQEFPFRKILETLFPNERLANYGAIGREPLLSIFLDYKGKVQSNVSETNFNGVSLYESIEKQTGSDLYIKIWEDGKLFVSFLYNSEIYIETTARYYLESYRRILLLLTERESLSPENFCSTL